MSLTLFAQAVLLGVVEGLTEFLPVSSTGHLIVAGRLLRFDYAHAQLFDVVIQFGAIVAVCWEFRRKLIDAAVGWRTRPAARRFAINVCIATAPAAVLALLFEKPIKALLFAPLPVAAALIVGGVAILWVERRQRGIAHPPRVPTLDVLTPVDALKVGLAQCCALIPGTSRSGATIVGGMLCGLDRRVATEFSFFLAIPLIFGATLYELCSGRVALGPADAGVLVAGSGAAFVSAFVCVRWLLRFVATHGFAAFAWYRIGCGLLIVAGSGAMFP